jgi:hypothetical protein
LGAHQVVDTLNGIEPVDVVVANVGGSQAVEA